MKKTTDHLGNEFKSETEMCRHYGIERDTYLDRIRYGWSKEDALTKDKRDINREPTCIDHLGNTYANQKAMCDYYGIEQTVFIKRMKMGWSLEKILTKPVRKRLKNIISTDHLGNEYPSQQAMCDYYGININTLRYRISKGMALEEALTKK